MSTSYKGTAIAVLPGLVMLVLFYSLAIHMRLSLGGWPDSIGESGFSRALAIHSVLAANVYVLLFFSLWVMPVSIFVCLLAERWQRFAIYFALYAGEIFFCFVLMQFAAPTPFLYWWQD